jgi:hypothetical protein
MNSSNPQTNAFLAELGQLSYKYKITIEGCGCCASPFLTLHEQLEKGTYWTDGTDGNITYSQEQPFPSLERKTEPEPENTIISKWSDEPIVMRPITDEELVKHSAAYKIWKSRQLEAQNAIRGDGI